MHHSCWPCRKKFGTKANCILNEYDTKMRGIAQHLLDDVNHTRNSERRNWIMKIFQIWGEGGRTNSIIE